MYNLEEKKHALEMNITLILILLHVLHIRHVIEKHICGVYMNQQKVMNMN